MAPGHSRVAAGCVFITDTRRTHSRTRGAEADHGRTSLVSRASGFRGCVAIRRGREARGFACAVTVRGRIASSIAERGGRQCAGGGRQPQGCLPGYRSVSDQLVA